MTGVLEPTTATARAKSATTDSEIWTGVSSNLRLLDSRRVDLTVLPRDRVGARFLGHFLASVVVPVVDLAMMVAPLAWRPTQVYAVLAMAVLATLLLTEGGRYAARLRLSVLDELPFVVARLLTAVAAVCATLLYMHQKAAELVFLETACQAVLLVIAGRIVTTRLIAVGRRAGIVHHRTVLMGGGPLAAELARIAGQQREYGLKMVGFIDDGDNSPAAQYLPRLGQSSDMGIAVSAADADTLLVADGCFDERALRDAVRTQACQHMELLVIPRLHHFNTRTGIADHIGSIPIMRIHNPRLRGPAQLTKRCFDIVVAMTALIILLPVLVGTALAVRIEGGPGIIFRQVRVGRDGKHFELLKFRSLRPANEHESQTMWCAAADNRVGPVGRILRCTSIDELPQLWNILRGDMTLVGPRPERPHFVAQFSTQFDTYACRHRVPVGLTGFAQVGGLRGDTSIADRARYDNFYIENWSLWLDIKIIMRTFREVLLCRGK